jgi:DNA-binding GntR family transcriptional regulator
MAQVQALSIVEAVAADLRRSLFSGDLTSEAQLTEADVATNYAVARPTAKAAIETLVAEGLLRRGKHKTARVPLLGPADVRDLYFARLSLETQVARALAEVRKVPKLATTSNAALLALQGEQGVGVVEPVIHFHQTLVDALGSPRISRLYSTLMGEMRLCMVQMQSRHLLSGAVIAAEHDLILERIAAGDPDGAVAAVTQHLHNAERRLFPEGTEVPLPDAVEEDAVEEGDSLALEADF